MDVEEMTNDEIRDPKECRMINSKSPHRDIKTESFGFRTFFRHSSFVIRPLPALAIATSFFAGCATDNPAGSPSAARLAYPLTRTTNVVEDYHGVKITDPYRWLEDD